MRKNGVLYKMIGHGDTITGLALSPDGSYILSNSMDNTRKLCFVMSLTSCLNLF